MSNKTEAEQIDAAHPLHTGRHDLFTKAMRLVGERHEKGDLVELVNWLLYRIDALNKDAVDQYDNSCSHSKLIDHPGDETFLPRKGCLICNKWLQPVRMK